MSYRYALAGNPNCGKTTLFNAVTGSNQLSAIGPVLRLEKKGGQGHWQRSGRLDC